MSRSTRQQRLARTAQEKWERLSSIPDAIARLIAEETYNPPVRVHSALAYTPEARLWYLLRSLDPDGRGAVRLNLKTACDLLNRSQATLYRLLKSSLEQGYIRSWQSKKQDLVVYLGSRDKVARAQNLDNWGTTIETTLKEVIESLKATATQGTAQRLQSAARQQAKQSRPRSQKKTRLATPEELLDIPVGAFPYLASGRRAIPAGVEGADGKRIYVGPSFAHYGVSQSTIGDYCDISERTVRRHLEGIERKQLMQTYPQLDQARAELTHCKVPTAGVTLNGAHVEVEYGRLRRYRNKTYLRRCAIYRLDCELKSERYGRKKYRMHGAAKP